MRVFISRTSLLFIAAILFGAQLIYSQQGGLDTTFGGGTGIYQDDKPTLPLPADAVNIGRGYVFNEVLANGKIIVAGGAIGRTPGNSYFGDFVLRRLNANGTVDTSFGNGGDVQTTFYRFGAGVGQQSDTGLGAMKVQPDGKIILAGICRINGAPDPNTQLALGNDLCIIRYNANGSIDTSFGGNTVMVRNGATVTPYTMEAGKVWTQTGTNFINNNTVNTSATPVKIQIAPDGRIFVFGTSRDEIIGGTSNGGGRVKGFVAVYSGSGALQNINSIIDTTGNSTDGWGEVQIFDGELLSNGDYLAVGQHRTLVSTNPTVFSQYRWQIFSGNSGGIFLDADVNAGGSARSITMVRSNKILIGGQTGGQFGPATLVRYNGDLTVDATFGTNGRIVYNGTVSFNPITGLKTQPDGKIIVVDSGGNIGRLNPDGSFDRSFARYREDIADGLDRRGLLGNYRYVSPFPVPPGGDMRVNFGNVSFGTDGKLVTSGCVACPGNVTLRGVVTRLKTSFRNGGTLGDFNGDGKAEVAVFRPSDGVWYQLDSFSNSFGAAQWGTGTDKIAPADYDGDGRTDLAVFRNGVWYIQQSSNGQIRYEFFGTSGDLPVPGDFNGDGQADIAVFRPSNGNWYIHYSNPVQPGNVSFTSVHFGQSGDVPVVRDFDGDGKTDITVFRSGDWYQLLSATNSSFQYTHFGLGGDVPVAGDYDGDGKADIAVFRNGIWYALTSLDGSVRTTQWGIASDKPVPADYDNDGKTDVGVYRGGTWYILRSSDNTFSATNFGLSTDIPIPAAYQP